MSAVHRFIQHLSSDANGLEVRIAPTAYGETAGILHMIAAVVGASKVQDLGGGMFSFSNLDESNPYVPVLTAEQLAHSLDRLCGLGQPVVAPSGDQMVVHLWLSFEPTRRHLDAILEKLQPYGAVGIAVSERPVFEGTMVEICMPPLGMRAAPAFENLNWVIRELFPFGKPWDELARF